MTDAYLAIVSVAGVELIARETADTRRFLLRRCYRRRPRTEACYWACLAAEQAELIRWLAHCGQQGPALWLLNEAARDAGLLTPSAPACEGTPGFILA